MRKVPLGKNEAIRQRVKRLVRGKYVGDDIPRLLGVLRHREHGLQSLKEVGHFFGHEEHRDQGLVTRSAIDWYLTVTHALKIQYNLLDEDSLPANLPEVLRASSRRFGLEETAKHIDQKPKVTQRALKSLIAKFGKNRNGQFQFVRPVTEIEYRVYNTLSRVVVGRASFTDQELFDDFCTALVKNRLIDHGEVPELDWVKIPLALHAVAIMHQCIIELPETENIQLEAGYGDIKNGQKIHIAAGIRAPVDRKGGVITVYTDLFTTDISVTEQVEDLPITPDGGRWSCPIEVRPNMKLGPI